MLVMKGLLWCASGARPPLLPSYGVAAAVWRSAELAFVGVGRDAGIHLACHRPLPATQQQHPYPAPAGIRDHADSG